MHAPYNISEDCGSILIHGTAACRLNHSPRSGVRYRPVHAAEATRARQRVGRNPSALPRQEGNKKENQSVADVSLLYSIGRNDNRADSGCMEQKFDL
jgi:hypothetical protein